MLKNIAPESPKKNAQLNRLSNLVEYAPTMGKGPIISANNISLSPTKKKPEKPYS